MNHSIPYVHDYNLVRRANEINLVAINKHPVLNLTYVVDLTFVSRAPGQCIQRLKHMRVQNLNR